MSAYTNLLSQPDRRKKSCCILPGKLPAKLKRLNRTCFIKQMPFLKDKNAQFNLERRRVFTSLFRKSLP